MVYVKNKKIEIKKWPCNMFEQKVEFESFGLCSVIAFCGIVCTYILSSHFTVLESIYATTIKEKDTYIMSI